MPPPPPRKQPARRPLIEGHNRAEIVFVTICTVDRKPLLARDWVHHLLLEAWTDPANHWAVGRYVLLPDHLHLFCAPARPDALDLRRWVVYWKSLVSNRWRDTAEHPIWLPDLWDRQLRTGESYDSKWNYVKQNPVRHGLTPDAEAWPYQGELYRLDWHD